MNQKEYEQAQTVRAQAINIRDLEATQLVSVDDLKELERHHLFAEVAEPAEQRRTVIAAGIVFGLILAAILLLTVLLIRSGGHS